MFAVVYIPDFYLQAALRYEPELRTRPVALLSDKQSDAKERAIVLQCTSRAHVAEVRPGLTSVQASARCSQLIFKTYSAAANRAATDVLLQTAYAFSPKIELTADGVCTVDLRGLALRDDNARNDWAEKIRSVLARFHLHATVGFAETPALALLAARATKSILIANSASEFVSTLPIQSLDPDAEVRDILRRWGIHTVGALLSLGKGAVTERLDTGSLKLFERVSPDCIRPLNIIKPSESFEEEIEFDVVIETTEPLLFVLRRFVEQLAARIALSYRVVAELHLHLGLESGDAYERTFKIPAPTSNVETLFRMLHTHLENLRTDAPISSLRLGATPCRPEKQQFGLFENALRDPNHFHETLAMLTALFGSDRVGTPFLEITRRPDAFRMEVPHFHKPDSLMRKSQETAPTGTPLALRRFRPSIHAHVMLQDNRPVGLRSSVFAGAIHDSRGPFCSSGNWWDDTKWSRMEWDVEVDNGILYRLVQREEDWFIEGVYD